MGNMSFDTAAMLGWLFESTLYISVFICFILVLKAVTRGKLPAWWSYGLWILLIFRMLLPWGIETPLSIFNFFPAPPANDVYMPLLMSRELYIPFLEDASSAASLDRIFLTVWLAGILFFTITTLFKNLVFWMAIRRISPVTDRSVLDLLEECKALLRTRRTVQIVVTEKVKSPGLFGYLKPRLLLPPDFLDTVKKDELQCVFYHELGHLKSHDIGISWLVNFLQVVYWFNPFVWYGFHYMRVDQEVACDAYVLSRISQVKPSDYANTIVGLLARFVQNRQLPSLAGIIENKSQIKRRIAMIMNFKKHTYRMTLVSVFILITVGFVFFTSARGFSSEDRESNADINSKTAYGDAKNLNEVDSPPQVVRAFPPSYPFAAKEQKLNGRVVLRFVVDIEGWACEPEVVSAEPEGVFEEAALDAVAEYRFKPALKDGKPVNCIVKMPIKFTMSEDDEEILE